MATKLQQAAQADAADTGSPEIPPPPGGGRWRWDGKAWQALATPESVTAEVPVVEVAVTATTAAEG